jgi:hypothetical protein
MQPFHLRAMAGDRGDKRFAAGWWQPPVGPLGRVEGAAAAAAKLHRMPYFSLSGTNADRLVALVNSIPPVIVVPVAKKNG